MKDSGVEWIGEIPEEWGVQNLKSILTERKESNNPVKTDFILSLTNDRGVIPYTDKGDIGNKSKEDLTGYKLAYPNDIVLNSMNVIIGSVGLSNYFGAVSPVYYMLYPRNSNDCVKFFNYIFQTKVFQESLKGYGNGIMDHRLRIPMIKLNTAMLPYASSADQHQIATYLDQKVSQIDHILEETRKSIEEYKKYKQSIITEAVTKGLDPDVKMKDSGIEWIGEIPEHWEVVKMKHTSWIKGRIGWQGLKASEFIDSGPHLITGTDFQNGIINWDTCARISEDRYLEAPEIHIRENDLLITKDGTIGKVAIATDCPKEVSLNSGVFLIRNTKSIKYVNRFLYYTLLSDEFWLWYKSNLTGNSTILHLYQEQFYNFNHALPPIENQHQIADYLDNKCTEIDSLISQKETLLNDLESYKRSLIYECVTGKKEVV